MADDKLIFPIGFDLDGAVQVAIKDGKKAITKIQKELGKTPIQLDVDTKSLRAELKKLNDEWNKLSASQRAGVEGTKLREQYRALTLEANGYTSTLRSAVSAEDKATAAKQRSANATERQNSAYKTQSGYLQRLFQRMVAYASVTQAFSFLRNIREVTAQFELQRVALGSIIGDLNEANAMFEQIKAAAVKSPFQIKELVTYTKQLAAYKIETDELFETTQKLADVSAGLGVGMERLVLAYGQIRATGYLRASEVRQLTEAGIPIVEELAKKMSDLRGETVSAAEVMGMISERAISFGMVKEVFDDMTSAGGMFYKMQEKQAETLQGQWNNLKDSIAIMYEEIGNTERVNNAIKGMIGLVKSLAENWRVVGDVAVWSVGAALGYAKVIKPISDLIKKQSLLNKAKQLEIEAIDLSSKGYAKQAQGLNVIAANYRKSANAVKGFGGALKSIGTFIKGNIWGILLTVLASIVAYFISARKEAKRLNEELNKIGTEGALQADQSVRNFERLAKTIRESANGSREQSEALAEMKRTYGDLLPTQDEEVKALVRVKGGYEDVTRAIREKIDAQIYEQKMNKIISEYGEDVTDYESKLVSFFKGLGLEAREAYYVINRIKQETESGNIIPKSYYASSNARKVVDIIKKELGIATVGFWDILPKFQESNMWFGDELLEYSSTISDMKAATDAINDSFNSSINITRDYREKIEELNNSVNLLLQGYDLTTFEGKEKKIFLFVNAWKSAILKEFTDNQIDIGDAIKFDGKIDFKEILSKLEGKGLVQLEQFVKTIQKEYEKLVPEDLEQLIKERFISLGNQMGISLDKLQHYFKDSETSTQDWVKSLKEAKETIGNKIFDAKKLGQDTKELEGIQKILDIISKEWDNSKEIAKSAEQALKDELAAVEKIYKRYQDLRKLKSETDTQSILAKEFKGVSLTTLSKAYSPEQMIEVYQKALAEAQRLGKKDLVLEIQTKIGEFKVAEEQRKLEKSLKDISDKISRTKTAKEFFDKMLGLTGDKELSATLTLSVYGTTGDDLKSALVKQVEQAFDGVDISSAIDYNTMTINYQKLAEIYAKNQDKILDANKSMAESIVKDGQKTSASQIEQWAKELEAVKTYADKRVDIARQTQQRISEIEASTLPEDEKQRLQEQYRKKEEKDLAKLEYQSFKESPMYVAMFDNLDSASTTMLNNMRAKLMELKEAWGGLDMPTELKEMQSRLNEIDKQLASRNPFKTLANAYKGYQELREQGSRKEAEQDLIDKTARHAKEVAILNENIKEATRYQQAYDDAVAEYGKDSVQARTAEAQLYIANSVVETQKDSVNTTEDAVEASQELVNKWKELDDVVGGAWEQADMLTQAIINLGRNLADAFGGFGSEADAEYFDTMMDSFSNLSSGITSIGKGIATGNPIAIINGIGSAISGLVGLFTAGKVRKANKEIERQQELLDQLAYSYERLEKAQEKAFGSDYISNYEQRLENLQAQQDAYLKQAEAERSKGKKADDEKIKEYEEQARATADAIKDMQSELSEYFLGTDLTSASRDFANAWIDAYKEFGNTTDAMKEKFQDMIQNMIVESFAARVIQSALQDIFDSIDDMTKDGVLDVSEASKIADMTEAAVGNIDVGMTNLMNALSQAGISVRGMGSDLTGISRDIATASEESILGLAAGINTQNFYISQVPTKLDTIIGLLRGENAMQGSAITLQDLVTIQNQHLSYLPTIAQHTAETVAECKQIVAETRRTADALERVIKPRGTQATHTVNTSL